METVKYGGIADALGIESFIPVKDMSWTMEMRVNSNRHRHAVLYEIECTQEFADELNKVLVISGLGQTIYFDKKNIFNKKLRQKEIPNNIQDILTKNNYELIGIRDLYVEVTDVYISLLHKNSKGFSVTKLKSDGT